MAPSKNENSDAELVNAISRLSEAMEQNREATEQVVSSSAEDIKVAAEKLTHAIENHGSGSLTTIANLTAIGANFAAVLEKIFGGIAVTLGPLGGAAVAASIVIISGSIGLAVYNSWLPEDRPAWEEKAAVYKSILTELSDINSESCKKGSSLYSWGVGPARLVASKDVLKAHSIVKTYCSTESGDLLVKAMRLDLGYDSEIFSSLERELEDLETREKKSHKDIQADDK